LPEGEWFGGQGPEPVYFLHIEKTAGSSVHRVLTAAFPDPGICPTRLWQELEGVRPEDLRHFQLYSGHLTGSFADFLGRRLRTVTLLRDPVQRSISHYAHIRRDPSSPYYGLAQNLSLREFCLHPETRHLVEDYQARSLAGAALKAPQPWSKQIALRNSPQERADILARALAVVKDCVAVGVTERLPDTLAVFADTLGLDWSGHTPYENASYNRPKIVDAETLAVIRSITQLDAAIYDEAVAILSAAQRDRGEPSGDAPVATGRGQRRGILARLSLPERSHRFKLRLSAALCRAPRAVRVCLAWLYMAYRIMVDQKVPLAGRIPLLLAGLYVIRPIDIVVTDAWLPGHLDDGLALVVGVAVSVLIIGRDVIEDLWLAATTRFDLGPSGEERPKPFRRGRLL
jgi:uncharacterized membrane protein YkvA (DUF1232 family)